MSARSVLLLCLTLPATSCVSYTTDPTDPVTIATEVRQRRGGRFTFAQAVQTAFRQNAELRTLAAKARGAGAVVEPTELQAEWRSDDDMLAVMIDPVAMLDLGARGAANSEAHAAAEEAVLALAAGRWQTAGALAEIYEVGRALAALAVPSLALDADAYQRAGLASPLAADQLRAAQARANAERIELDQTRERLLADFRRLIGLPEYEPVELVPSDPAWLRQPEATDQALLARPDLAVAAATFRTADAAFRRAVLEQYPSLMIGPDIPLLGAPLQAMAVLRLPIGASGRAIAARERREAARAELEAVCLEASRQAHHADADLAAAEANAEAAMAGQRASENMLAGALIEARVDGDAFERVANAAAMAMRDTMERRAAALELARARVRRAVAYGWPVSSTVAAEGS